MEQSVVNIDAFDHALAVNDLSQLQAFEPYFFKIMLMDNRPDNKYIMQHPNTVVLYVSEVLDHRVSFRVYSLQHRDIEFSIFQGSLVSDEFNMSLCNGKAPSYDLLIRLLKEILDLCKIRALFLPTETIIEKDNTPNAEIFYYLNKKVNLEISDALHYCAYYNKPAIAESLISNGFNIGGNNPELASPLTLAIQQRSTHMVDLLLRRGAGINQTLPEALLEIISPQGQYCFFNSTIDLNAPPEYIPQYEQLPYVMKMLKTYPEMPGVDLYMLKLELMHACTYSHARQVLWAFIAGAQNFMQLLALLNSYRQFQSYLRQYYPPLIDVLGQRRLLGYLNKAELLDIYNNYQRILGQIEQTKTLANNLENDKYVVDAIRATYPKWGVLCKITTIIAIVAVLVIAIFGWAIFTSAPTYASIILGSVLGAALIPNSVWAVRYKIHSIKFKRAKRSAEHHFNATLNSLPAEDYSLKNELQQQTLNTNFNDLPKIIKRFLHSLQEKLFICENRIFEYATKDQVIETVTPPQTEQHSDSVPLMHGAVEMEPVMDPVELACRF